MFSLLGIANSLGVHPFAEWKVEEMGCLPEEISPAGRCESAFSLKVIVGVVYY